MSLQSDLIAAAMRRDKLRLRRVHRVYRACYADPSTGRDGSPASATVPLLAPWALAWGPPFRPLWRRSD